MGTAFVSYDDIYDAKRALEKLGGFNVGGRYLVVLYYQVGKGSGVMGGKQGKEQLSNKKKEVEALKREVEELQEDV